MKWLLLINYPYAIKTTLHVTLHSIFFFLFQSSTANARNLTAKGEEREREGRKEIDFVRECEESESKEGGVKSVLKN